MAEKVHCEASDDGPILAAFDRWQAACRRYNAAPPCANDDADADDMTPAERAAWAEMGEAEAAVIGGPASTPQGASAQLRLALHYAVSARSDEEALLSGDLRHLIAKAADFDPQTRCTLMALASLSGMAR